MNFCFRLPVALLPNSSPTHTHVRVLNLRNVNEEVYLYFSFLFIYIYIIYRFGAILQAVYYQQFINFTLPWKRLSFEKVSRKFSKTSSDALKKYSDSLRYFLFFA